jgi:outer membrane protein
MRPLLCAAASPEIMFRHIAIRTSWKAALRAATIALAASLNAVAAEATNQALATPRSEVTNDMPALLAAPLSVADALNIAAAQNGTVLKAKQDLEAQYGVAVQTRAIVLPRLTAGGNFRRIEDGRIETFGGSNLVISPSVNRWTLGVQVVQSVYDGGRMQAAWRSAKLQKEQALFDYQTVVADALLAVRIAYDDALLATNEIVVREASVALLTKQLEDTKRRFDAGVVPQFNVLRAEVELANANPPLIRTRNLYRIAKQRLVNELGVNLPRSVLDDVPLRLSGKLEKEPYPIDLPSALAQALEKRTELASMRTVEQLRKEGVKTAKSGYLPTLQIFAGYGADSRQFTDAFQAQVHGWEGGARAEWNFFDGMLTKGRVEQAKALQQRAIVDYDDATRRIELEVRTTYSTFSEAKEVLDSQEKVTEQAVEALRLANSRYDAGTGTQLDVLSAQTALTDARTTYVRALREYSVARSRLERAIGASIQVEPERRP